MTPGTSKYFDKVKHKITPESKDRVKKLLDHIDMVDILEFPNEFLKRVALILVTLLGVFVAAIVVNFTQLGYWEIAIVAGTGLLSGLIYWRITTRSDTAEQGSG